MDKTLFKKIAREHGFTCTALAKALGISRYALYKKINGATEFRLSEIGKIVQILGLSVGEREAIFFAE